MRITIEDDKGWERFSFTTEDLFITSFSENTEWKFLNISDTYPHSDLVIIPFKNHEEFQKHWAMTIAAKDKPIVISKILRDELDKIIKEETTDEK